MTPRSAMNAYNSVKAHADVSDASPHQLVLLLMKAAIDRMNFAKGAIRRVEIENRTKQINKAVDIIGALKNALDFENGAEIAKSLDSVYGYILIQLSRANSDNDAAVLDECIELISTIKEGWEAIGPEVNQK